MAEGGLSGALSGMTSQLTDLHKAIGSVTESLGKIADVAKEAVDPAKELLKLFGEDFPKAANFFSESYKIVVERLRRGDITIDQALESLLAMERVLNQFGLKPGDSAGLDAWSRKLQEIIRALDRAKRRP